MAVIFQKCSLKNMTSTKPWAYVEGIITIFYKTKTSVTYKLCFIKVIITFSESWIMNYTPAKQLSKFIDMIPGVRRIGKSQHQLS